MVGAAGQERQGRGNPRPPGVRARESHDRRAARRNQQESGRNPPHLLRVPDGDRDAVRGHDEAEAEEGHEAEAGIDKCRGRDDSDCEAYRRRQVVSPRERGQPGAALGAPVDRGHGERGDVVEDVLLNPQAEAERGRRQHEARPNRVRCQAVTPSRSAVPARNVMTMSALPLRVHSTSDGGPAISNPVAIQATRREKSRATSWKFRHAYTAAHASVTALSVITPGAQT